MQEILQADILEAVAAKIKSRFADVKIYLDGEILEYPNFYLSFKNFGIENIGLRHYQRYRLTFSMRVEYRQAADITKVVGLNSKLNNVGMSLLDLLLWFELYGKRQYTKLVSNEIVNNIRIVDFDFSLIGSFQQLEEAKMLHLKNQVQNKKIIKN